MAVFRQELNWSKYQEDQLEILKKLNNSFERSLSHSSSMTNNMSKIEAAISFMASASENSAKNISAITKSITGQSIEFTAQMKEAAQVTQTMTQESRRTSDSLRTLSNNTNSAGRTILSFAADVGETLYELGGKLRGFGEQLNSFSEMNNQMIQLSGASGDDVRGFRTDILNEIAKLNMVTGHAYSPKESYNKLIAVSQGVTGNLEAISEMARPLLLAQESLDVNIQGVAELFNRFYTKYNFSSSHMEAALDGIRGNTANNAAEAEATLKNIESLEVLIDRIAGNDNDKRSDLMSQISNYTSWLESMGLDSAFFTSSLESIAYGDYSKNPELLNMLTRSGISGTQATDMFEDGQLEDLTVALMKGIYEMVGTVDDSYALGRALDNLGLDRRTAMSIVNAMNSENWTSLDEFKEITTENTQTMVDLVEDKYVSMQDKANHWLEQIYGRLAHIQEHLGIGLSDLALAAAILKPNLPAGGVRNLVGNVSGTGTVGSGLLGTLEMGGFHASQGALTGGSAAGLGALTVGGAAAGLGMTAYGGYNAYKDFQNGDIGYGVGNTIGAAGGLAGAGLLTAALLGASTGPAGWIALGIGGAALAGVEIAKELTPVSGAAESITKSFENLQLQNDENYYEEIKNLNLLEKQINSMGNTSEDFEEAMNLAKDSGLLDFQDATINSKEELLNLIDSTKDATAAIHEMTSAAIEQAKFQAEQTAKEQTDSVKQSVYDAVMSMGDMRDTGTLLKENNEEEFEMVRRTFLGMANSIKDEDAKAAALKDIDKIFKDNELSMNELKLLTDLGGGLFTSGSRQNSVFRQDIDFNSFNASLGYLGADVEGFDLTGVEASQKLPGLYQQWAKSSTTEEQKESIKKEFKSIYDSLDEMDRVAYRAMVDEMGIPRLAVGTNYVPRDQLAYLHEGEAVIPKQYNLSADPTNANRLSQYMQDSQADSARGLELLSDLVDNMNEIKEFLNKWKSDNDRAATASNMMNRHSYGRDKLVQYQY